jgi:NAD+ synthase
MHSVIIQRILRELGVNPIIDVPAEATRRINFLDDYLETSKQGGYVLGISGGVDSTTAGRMAQLAVEQARAKGRKAINIAVRLPYGEQRDEADAQAALDFIKPDLVLTVNIKESADAILASLNLTDKTPFEVDFILGNIKARVRMQVQYAIAAAYGCLVIGTDHNAEAVMGFFTKFGDGAADITPLVGYNKRQVRATAVHLGAPQTMAFKPPTADLESLNPGLLDEDSYGVTYDEIDDLLEGKAISEVSTQKIVDQFTKTAHKRALPVTP